MDQMVLYAFNYLKGWFEVYSTERMSNLCFRPPRLNNKLDRLNYASIVAPLITLPNLQVEHHNYHNFPHAGYYTWSPPYAGSNTCSPSPNRIPHFILPHAGYYTWSEYQTFSLSLRIPYLLNFPIQDTTLAHIS